MLCNVVFKGEKSCKELRSRVDLDYFSIREWRSLYMDFLKCRKEQYGRLIFEPLDYPIWL